MSGWEISGGPKPLRNPSALFLCFAPHHVSVRLEVWQCLHSLCSDQPSPSHVVHLILLGRVRLTAWVHFSWNAPSKHIRYAAEVSCTSYLLSVCMCGKPCAGVGLSYALSVTMAKKCDIKLFGVESFSYCYLCEFSKPNQSPSTFCLLQINLYVFFYSYWLGYICQSKISQLRF